jgi:hypothetical protein
MFELVEYHCHPVKPEVAGDHPLENSLQEDDLFGRPQTLICHHLHQPARKMMEKQSRIRALRPSSGEDTPVCIEGQCQLRQQW